MKRVAVAMSDLDMAELRAFGAEAHRLEFPCIAGGGFVVSGRLAASSYCPEKEESNYGQCEQTGSEAGSAAWSRQRSSAKAVATSTAAHAVKRSPAVTRVVEELQDYGAKISVIRSSDRFLNLAVPIGLFATLPFRARLYFEVPLMSRRELTQGLQSNSVLVPDVRVWSRWTCSPDGETGLIRSHHKYPDDSMCVCMMDQWQLGRDALITYVDFSILWVARVLHERLIGFYPGRQHYGEKARVERDRPNEFCGCGSVRTYASCHRDSDMAMPSIERAKRHYEAHRVYLEQLKHQRRPINVPSVDLPSS